MNTEKISFNSDYFKLEQIAEGVFAAIENTENDAGSNAGFVDMGDFTIVFDTFLSLEAAKDLKTAAERLTNKTPKYIINSHFHADHTLGNMIFTAEGNIVASEKMREAMISTSRQQAEELKSVDPKELEDLKIQILHETDETTLLNLKNQYKYISNLMNPELEYKYPTITFKDTMYFHGSKRNAKLIAYGPAHSPSDVIMLLPDDKLCFMGDLLFNGMHPWLGAGDPDNFIKVIEDIQKLDIDTYIPGHGDIAGRDKLELQKKYIIEILALVNKKYKEGIASASITLDDISEEFRAWDKLTFGWNIDFLYKQIQQVR